MNLQHKQQQGVTMKVQSLTCSVIQPTCLTSIPGCMTFISPFILGKRVAMLFCMALYQDWAMAGSFARRKTEFFLVAEITSKYLTGGQRGEQGDEAAFIGPSVKVSDQKFWWKDTVFKGESKNVWTALLPVFCVWRTLFPWHLAHLQRDAAGLFHLCG